MVPEYIKREAKQIAATWGQAAADRYLSFQSQLPIQQQSTQPIRRKRWVSNTQHQPRRLNTQQAAMVCLLKDSGQTCRQIGQAWGLSQGTVSTINRRRGAYKA